VERAIGCCGTRFHSNRVVCSHVCKFLENTATALAMNELVAVNEDQQTHAQNQDNSGDPELNVRQDGLQCGATALVMHMHPPLDLELT
jgi:hypothetical protein